MLKALVFLSVIVSLAFSAPYGGYGGQSHTMVSGGDLSLGVGLVDGRGLGGIGFGTSVPLAASSSIIDSSSNVVGVGAPLAQRIEAEPATFVHEVPALSVSHIVSVPVAVAHEPLTAPGLATIGSHGAIPALTVAHEESAPVHLPVVFAKQGGNGFVTSAPLVDGRILGGNGFVTSAPLVDGRILGGNGFATSSPLVSAPIVALTQSAPVQLPVVFAKHAPLAMPEVAQ